MSSKPALSPAPSKIHDWLAPTAVLGGGVVGAAIGIFQAGRAEQPTTLLLVALGTLVVTAVKSFHQLVEDLVDVRTNDWAERALAFLGAVWFKWGALSARLWRIGRLWRSDRGGHHRAL